MNASVLPGSSPDHRDVLHARFLALVPRIELHGRIFFRHVRCPQKREDAIQEMVALSWQWFVRLALQRKDAAQFPSALARFAALAVRSGRRLCGQEKSKDVLSPVAQRRHHFLVETLPDCDTPGSNPLAEALRDNTQTPVPEQVAFRIDWPAWLRTRTERDRRLIEDLLCGERTGAVSHKFGLSPPRISQLRREFHDAWQRFGAGTADAAEAAPPA